MRLFIKWFHTSALVAAAAMAVGTAPARAASIFPTDIGSTRVTPPGSPLELGFLAVKNLDTPLEDRLIVEFDVSGLGPVAPTYFFSMTYRNIDTGGSVGTVDFYTYQGDGVVDTTDHSAAGSLFTNQPVYNVDGPGDDIGGFFFDITPAIQAVLDNSSTYLAVRLQAPLVYPDSDRIDSNNGLDMMPCSPPNGLARCLSQVPSAFSPPVSPDSGSFGAEWPVSTIATSGGRPAPPIGWGRVESCIKSHSFPKACVRSCNGRAPDASTAHTLTPTPHAPRERT